MEGKRIFDKSKRDDGQRERAPARGAEVSEKPMKTADLNGTRDRAPAKRVMDSDNSTQLLDSTHGGGNKGALGSGKGKRGQAPVLEARDSDDPSTSLGGDAMDSSETLAGKRERAPLEGVMDSETPTQSIDKRSRIGDLHLAFVMGKEVVKEHAQWRQSELEEKIDTQNRLDPGASVFLDGGGPSLSAWVAGARNRILIQESPEGEERTFPDLAKMAKVKELDSTAGHSTERLCGYALGPHLEGSRRRENSQGKAGGQRLSGPRSSRGQRGYCVACKPQGGYLWGPWGSGRCGALISRMPASRPFFAATFFFALHVSGIPRMLAAFGNRGNPLKGWMTPRRLPIAPCASTR